MPLFEQVIQKVRRGELSRAAKKLVASPLAPGTQQTLDKLSDPRRRPTQLFRPISAEALHHEPANSLMLSKRKFLENVRSAKRGSAPGRCGTRHEHYRVLLEDIRVTDNLYYLAQMLAVGAIPEAIREGLAVAHLTALQKLDETGTPTGDVRGIATGIVLRRLVARTVAQQYSAVVLQAPSPFQYALSTRAGVDCVALMIKLLTDMDEDTTITSLDGVGAYDHVSRACFLEELSSNPELAPLLPFVRMWYSRPSTYTWRDEHNTVHHIPQAEGVEQGDPLSPLLFSLAVHASLRHANESLRPGEYLFAFLDDVYTVTSRSRATAVARMVAASIHDHAGVEPKLGKFQIWGRGGGPEPPGIDDLLEGAPRPEEPVWKGDLEDERNGIVILGTPVGSPAFVQRFLGNRLEVQSRFWERLKQVPDLQTAWLLLLYCAVPRANHLIRAIPPDVVAEYARAHDDGIWTTFLDIIGYLPRPADGQEERPGADHLPIDRGNVSKGEGKGRGGRQAEASAPPSHESRARGEVEVGVAQEQAEGGREAAQPSGSHSRRPGAEPTGFGPEPADPILDAARRIAFLPVVQGGLGLRSMSLLSPAAYWAAWADVLPIIAERVPALAEAVLPGLERADSPIHCVAQAIAAEAAVTGPTFPLQPSWRELADGARPPQPDPAYEEEPGQWPHGWQFYASLGLLNHHREHVVLPNLGEGAQARLRSQSGAHAGDHITALPTSEYTIASSQRMNGMLRRRARLPLATGCRHCPATLCQRSGASRLDDFGDHGAGCQRTGALRRRGAAVERAWRPLWKESTVDASEHPLVHELVPTVPQADLRQSDVFIRGMSIGNGQPVVGDMCMGSALHANGRPYPHATAEDGKAIDRLTGQKHDKYPELVTSDRVHFVVLACEEGGRWGPDVFEVINDLVRLKVAPLHPLLRRSAALAYTRRWWSILAMGAQSAAIDCILGRDPQVWVPHQPPPLASVLAEADIAPEPSRLG